MAALGKLTMTPSGGAGALDSRRTATWAGSALLWLLAWAVEVEEAGKGLQDAEVGRPDKKSVGAHALCNIPGTPKFPS